MYTFEARTRREVGGVQQEVDKCPCARRRILSHLDTVTPTLTISTNPSATTTTTLQPSPFFFLSSLGAIPSIFLSFHFLRRYTQPPLPSSTSPPTHRPRESKGEGKRERDHSPAWHHHTIRRHPPSVYSLPFPRPIPFPAPRTDPHPRLHLMLCSLIAHSSHSFAIPVLSPTPSSREERGREGDIASLRHTTTASVSISPFHDLPSSFLFVNSHVPYTTYSRARPCRAISSYNPLACCCFYPSHEHLSFCLHVPLTQWIFSPPPPLSLVRAHICVRVHE